jgi:hypothetical protein
VAINLAGSPLQIPSIILHNTHYAPNGSTQDRLSAKSLEALRILQSEPHGAHGLDIVAKSEGLLSRASIYVVLGDLEEQGLVRAKRARRSGDCRARDIQLRVGASRSSMSPN